jgi:hypothetical protein
MASLGITNENYSYGYDLSPEEEADLSKLVDSIASSVPNDQVIALAAEPPKLPLEPSNGDTTVGSTLVLDTSKDYYPNETEIKLEDVEPSTVVAGTDTHPKARPYRPASIEYDINYPDCMTSPFSRCIHELTDFGSI